MTGAAPPGSEDSGLAAAEYVLGTLSPEQARAFEALVLSDSAAAASLQTWEARLGPLSDAVPPVAPPPELWRRLALAAGISDAPPRKVPTSRAAGLWSDLRLWRGLALGAGAVAAALALVLLRPPPGPELLAALSQAGTPGATFLVRIGADGTATIIAMAANDWLIPVI